jgi:hypothetical protein
MCLLLDEALALRSSRLKRVYQAGITAGESRASSSVLVPEVNLVISTWRAACKTGKRSVPSGLKSTPAATGFRLGKAQVASEITSRADEVPARRSPSVVSVHGTGRRGQLETGTGAGHSLARIAVATLRRRQRSLAPGAPRTRALRRCRVRRRLHWAADVIRPAVFSLGHGVDVRRWPTAQAAARSALVHGASPWVEAEGLYVHAGRLGGAGFAVGAGLAFPVGAARKFWLGPFVRYLDVLQPNHLDLDNRALSNLFAGFPFDVVLTAERRLTPRQVAFDNG